MYENIAIGAVTGINRTATNALKGGYSYSAEMNTQKMEEVGDTKIKPDYRTHPFSGTEFSAFKDLLGKKYGHFTVLGLSHQRAGRWVVRCSCGIYSFRKARAIRNGIINKSNDSCEECRKVHHRKPAIVDSVEKIPYRVEVGTGGLNEREAFAELIGKKVGTFTVLGLAVNKSGRWVVQCACGMYSTRTASSLKKGIEAICKRCSIKILNE